MIKILINLITLCCFCLTSCSTVRRQPYETVQVSSIPSGAVITVNGRTVGNTPLDLSMNPKHAHQIVLEKEGYETKSYIIQSKTSGLKLSKNSIFPVGGAAIGALGAFAVLKGGTDVFTGLLVLIAGIYGLGAGAAIGVVALGVDLYSGKAKQLSTHEIKAELVPVQQ